MDVGSVSTEMVRASPEGLEHWACLGLDLGARGAAGQALNRALKKAAVLQARGLQVVGRGSEKKVSDLVGDRKKFRTCGQAKDPDASESWLSCYIMFSGFS